MKRVIPRPKADREIDAAVLYYAGESLNVARDFLDEIKTALQMCSDWEHKRLENSRFFVVPNNLDKNLGWSTIST